MGHGLPRAMTLRVGVVGGTGGVPREGDEVMAETPWGDVPLRVDRRDDLEVVGLERHGADHDRPAHMVRHRANVWALHRSRVDRVVALHTVGSLRPEVPAGSLAVPHDLVDATGGGPSFHDDEVVHVAMTPPFCPEVRGAVLDGAGDDVVAEAVYVQTTGPRLETAAEARWLATLGELVGMTAAHEATLARELGLCYGSLSLVTNPAPGVGEGAVDAGTIAEAAAALQEEAGAVLERALDALPPEKGCACAQAPDRGRLGSR